MRWILIQCRSSSDLFSFASSPGNAAMAPFTASPKQLVKRWQVTETELGRGAFGKVFLGMNSDTGELIAVKRVDIEGTDAEQEQVSCSMCLLP